MKTSHPLLDQSSHKSPSFFRRTKTSTDTCPGAVSSLAYLCVKPTLRRRESAPNTRNHRQTQSEAAPRNRIERSNSGIYLQRLFKDSKVGCCGHGKEDNAPHPLRVTPHVGACGAGRNTALHCMDRNLPRCPEKHQQNRGVGAYIARIQRPYCSTRLAYT